MAQRRSIEQEPEQPPILVVLGANIFRRRVLRVPKMSQDVVADLAGVAVNTIQELEVGRDPAKPPPSYPRLDTIEKIARGLGCRVDDLLRWDPGTPSYLSGKNRLGPNSRLRVIPNPRPTDATDGRPAVASRSVPRLEVGRERDRAGR